MILIDGIPASEIGRSLFKGKPEVKIEPKQLPQPAPVSNPKSETMKLLWATRKYHANKKNLERMAKILCRSVNTVRQWEIQNKLPYTVVRNVIFKNARRFRSNNNFRHEYKRVAEAIGMSEKSVVKWQRSKEVPWYVFRRAVHVGKLTTK